MHAHGFDCSGYSVYCDRISITAHGTIRRAESIEIGRIDLMDLFREQRHEAIKLAVVSSVGFREKIERVAGVAYATDR